MLKRVLIIFETTEIQGNDWMVEICAVVCRPMAMRYPICMVVFSYIPHGGLKLKRLANALFMLVLLPFVLFFEKTF